MMIDLVSGKLNELLRASFQPMLEKSSKIVVVTDKHVEKLHLPKLVALLPRENTLVISIKPGELSKSRATKAKIETEMFEFNCDRDTLLIAFGGGLIGDLTGFVAATFMRGIRYINIPTTLLAMVDSSIGGKVGINVPQGKNLIGVYWQPQKIIMDADLLISLPALQIINGAIEAFKMFLTCDVTAVNKFASEIDKIKSAKIENLKWLIQRSVEIKSEIVQQDEHETELRKILNFGHTVGHALEKASDYQILHGVAVGYGILVESKISCLLGFLDDKNYQKIKSILNKLGLNKETLNKFDIDNLISLMKADKKNQEGEIYCVLLNGIGSVNQDKNKVAHPVDPKLIKRAIQEILSEA